MIRINRTKHDQSEQEILPSDIWFERARTATEEAINEKDQHKFRDEVYGATEVRVRLIELSHDKCAYCEYPLPRTDFNVEHYRPKGRVHESKCHLGYYWLAYDWYNFLPACEYCNQPRRELPTSGSTRRTRAKGKGDKFPLRDEAQRAFSPTDVISKEEPLLVNPTTEEPSEHITFDPLGKPIPRTDKGEASIEICNLDTKRLNDQRRKIIKETAGLFRLSKMARAKSQNPEAKQYLSKIEAMIREKAADSANFAAAARAVIKNPDIFE